MADDFDQLSFPETATKGDRTRLRLVEATLDVLAKQGGARLTFEAVGLVAGMNRAQVRYHFPDLGELVRDAVKVAAHRSQQYALAKLAAPMAPRERLARYVDVAFESSRDLAYQIPTLVHGYERALHDGEFRSLYVTISDAGNARLKSLLADVLTPLAPEDSAVTALAEDVRSLLSGLVLDMHLRGRVRELARYVVRAKAAAFALVAEAAAGALKVSR